LRAILALTRPALVAATLLALVAGCTGSAASPGPSGGISVTGAWIRATTLSTGTLAAYFVITNNGPQADTLLSASTPLAGTVQLHETVTVTPAPGASGGMGSMGSAMPAGEGMMTMVEVPSVDIPAGGTIEFKPGGYHVMLMDLQGSPAVGQTVDLTLVFAKAGPITVKAELRNQ
jgi:copper(I)-binding protein